MLQVKVGNKSINSSYLGFVTLLFLFWCDRTILSYVKGVIGSNEILLSFYDITIVIVMIICWLLVLKDIVSGFSIIDIVITCFFVGFYILAIYDYNAREYALENSYRFFVFIFPLFFLGRIFPQNEEERTKVFDLLYFISFWGVILAVLYTFYVLLTGRNWTGADNMAHAYSALFSLLYIIWYKGDKLRKLNVVVVVTGFAYLVAMGTRGALLAALVWWLVCFLIQKENGRLKKLLVISCIVVLGMLTVTGMMQYIILSAYGIFSKFGLNIRIFEYFLNHDIANANGRELIVSNLSRYILEVGGISGFFYDQVVNYGVYAHNLFIELLVDFGNLFGGIIIAILALLMYGGIKKANNKRYREFILMFITGVLIKLMLSSSFLYEPFFFFLLGISVNSIRLRRNSL